MELIRSDGYMHAPNSMANRRTMANDHIVYVSLHHTSDETVSV